MAKFTVKAVENDAEYIAADILMSVAFGDIVNTERILAALDDDKQRPAFQFDQHRIGVLDGEIIAHAVARPYTLRYGTAELTFGGIGGVCSHPEQRMKGYVAAVMRDAIAYMQARGDHLSLLNTGVDNLYAKFGYQTLWSDGSVEIEAAAALHLSSSLKVRAAVVNDVPQMAALFERTMVQRVTMRRSRDIWTWRMAR